MKANGNDPFYLDFFVSLPNIGVQTYIQKTNESEYNVSAFICTIYSVEVLELHTVSLICWTAVGIMKHYHLSMVGCYWTRSFSFLIKSASISSVTWIFFSKLFPFCSVNSFHFEYWWIGLALFVNKWKWAINFTFFDGHHTEHG